MLYALSAIIAFLGLACGAVGIVGYHGNSPSATPLLLIGIFIMSIAVFLKPRVSS